jgi:hypothetical protein
LAGWAGLNANQNNESNSQHKSAIMTPLSKTPPTPPPRFIEESTTHTSSWFDPRLKLLSFASFGKGKKSKSDNSMENENLLEENETRF